ncbi:abl interactor 1-like isoform X2 [Mya arenaria]|uniref:abl interactor 1-like isoform X2 n=1 Tax=Mya arenaria TaxID=6604 RepID=UPI0022E6D27C|nr:abl interactor 1-like isoform X2 [Mya arenaria]
MSELLQLIDAEIPDGRHNLQENFTNLEQVAQYCQENYLTAKDKRKALEETKNYTTHSLASVAYQINNLATNFLKLLDLQQNQLAEMESNVNHLAQTVNIHKEKVARREIGVLTTNRSTTRPLGVKNGIIFPEHGEKPTKYQRKNIDYTSLDDVGHGVKSGGPPSRQDSIQSKKSVNVNPAPGQMPPTPPGSRNSITSLGRDSQQGPYRTPAPMVAPPTVPNDYASRQEIQQASIRASQGQYAPGTPPVMMGMPRLPPGPGLQYGPGMVGVARPMSQGMPPPPPPPAGMIHDPRQSGMLRQTSIDPEDEAMPPPPPPDPMSPPRDSQNGSFDEGSPFMPPPPEDFHAPPPHMDDDDDDDDMPPMHEEDDPYAATGPEMFQSYVPEVYLEKVIAIYDYSANKEDELSFSENSMLYVLKKNDDGWYEGTINGVTGLFPGNYVEACI